MKHIFAMIFVAAFLALLLWVKHNSAIQYENEVKMEHQSWDWIPAQQTI